MGGVQATQELSTQTAAWKETLLNDLDVKELEATVQRWHAPAVSRDSRPSPHVAYRDSRPLPHVSYATASPSREGESAHAC